MKVVGLQQIGRYFGALTRLKEKGLFQNYAAHQRTIDGEIYGFIGRAGDFKK